MSSFYVDYNSCVLKLVGSSHFDALIIGLAFTVCWRLFRLVTKYVSKSLFFVQRLDGTIRGEQRKQSMEHFNADGSPVDNVVTYPDDCLVCQLGRVTILDLRCCRL